MITTIGQAVSRIRNVLKAVKEDPFITDRFLYSLMKKYAKTLLYRDNKLLNVFKNSGLFQEIPCVDLIEVSKVEACCISVKTSCTFMRSKHKLPSIVTLENGELIKSVTTLDYSIQVHKTHPTVYANMSNSTNFKYNKNKYYWIIEDYLYIPDVDWEAVRIAAMFDEDVTAYQCSDTNEKTCILEQDRSFNIPEHLFAEIEDLVRQELLPTVQLPPDGADDNQNVMR